LAPETEIALFFVPDDYATGREPDVAQALFPGVQIVRASDYVKFALGANLAGAPRSADVVQYLGGDTLHALRVRSRLGGIATSYKFAAGAYAKSLRRAFAVDEKNAADLRKGGVSEDRLSIVGNLAVDGAFGEAAGTFALRAADDRRVAPGGVLIMPGVRKHEIESLVPFFVEACVRLRAIAPDLPVAFAVSPFTTKEELERALFTGGNPKVWGRRGTVVDGPDGLGIVPEGDSAPIPVVRDAMRFANLARMVLTIPGTKCIELAALGVPTMVCVPTNAPESVVINGPLQYLGRIPFVGIPLKRAVVLAVDARFPMTAQPNMDAGEFLMPELRGTLTPGYVAQRAAEYAADEAARSAAATRLRALYAGHVGAAERMARALLELAR
jgi:hypothetical protein